MGIIRESETLNPGDDGDSEPTTPVSEPSPNGQGPDGLPDFNVIVGAPDLAELIARPSTKNAREYRDKTAAVFKAVVVGSIHAGNFPDAATMLWHGPGAATAIGNLCDNNKRIANAVDMLTTPSSPIAECLLTVLPLVSQLARNHERQLAELPSRFNLSRQARTARKAARQEKTAETEPTFTIKVGRRRIPVRMNYRPKFLKFITRGALSQTQDPNQLATHVFTDPKVVRNLEKMGIIITRADDG